MASTVLPNGIIIPEKYSRDWYNDLYHNWQELDNLLAGGGANDGTLTIQKNGSTVGTFSANQATDETINLSVPTKTSDLTNDSGFITGVAWDDVSNKPTFAAVATSGSYDDLSNKPTIPTVNNATLTIQKNGATVNSFTANASSDVTCNITVPTKTSDLSNDSGFITSDATKIPLSGTNALAGSIVPSTDNSYDFGSSSYKLRYIYCNTAYVTNLNINGSPAGDILTHNANEFVPRSGGAVMTGDFLGKTSTEGILTICGADYREHGGNVLLFGIENEYRPGAICIIPVDDASQERYMWIKPDGTWTWSGTAVQLVSDQRLKQQISNIDDKLLDAWEDVDLVQFKYNDAVDQKGDKARLHTGYVVQQIDNACKEHGVDVSAYGLYCHEEYPEETEEVETEQADGTKVKETKVIREASEHYSLRYTEVYAIECMYLRRCIARLTARIEELEKGNNTK